MPAEHASLEVDDLARLRRLGPDLLHHRGVIAVRDEADVLAVGLVGDDQAELAGELAHRRLGQVAEREAQVIELVAGGREQEVALVAGRIGGAVELRPVRPGQAADVMAGGEAVGAEVAGEGEQVGELDRLVARHAGDRGSAAGIFVGEALDDRIAEAGLVVEDVMGDPEPLGDGLGVVDVAAGAAGLRAADRLAMVVELEGDPDHLGAGAGGERGDHRAVDPARHGDDDPGLGGGPVELEIGDHGGRYIGRKPAEAQRRARINLGKA